MLARELDQQTQKGLGVKRPAPTGSFMSQPDPSSGIGSLTQDETKSTVCPDWIH